jgi:L-amino acid N-acyltransferase YncA
MELLGDDDFMLEIRDARISDLPAISEIYNEAILETVATFDTESKTATEQENWFAEHGEVYPILVAEHNGSVVGWVSLNRWSDRKAYGFTTEISLYIEKNHRGRGYGRRLLERPSLRRDAGSFIPYLPG